MDTARARGFREADESEIVKHFLDGARDLLHVVPRRALGRIEIDHDVVRLLRFVGTRETRMDLDRRVVRHPHEGRHVVREDVGVLRLPRIDPALDPLGSESGLVLLIEVRAVDAVRERLQGERPVAQPRHEVRRDVGVVADEVGLRVAVLGEEDFLEVRQLDAFAFDRQHRRDPCGFVTVLRRSPRRRGALRGLLGFFR